MKANINGRTEDIRAVWFEDGKVTMIDQRELPDKVTIVSFKDYRYVAEAIRNMTTRGAPSIGATAAYGMCLAAINGDDIEQAAKDIKAARPTANDLFYAVDYMLDDLSKGKDPIGSADAYAQSMVDKCIKIGEYGGELIKDGYRLMTHCNAGALATVDVGTALAPMRKGFLRIRFGDETETTGDATHRMGITPGRDRPCDNPRWIIGTFHKEGRGHDHRRSG